METEKTISASITPFKTFLLRRFAKETTHLAPEQRRALLVALRKYGLAKAEANRQRALQLDNGELS